MEKHQTAISHDILKTRSPTGLFPCFMPPKPLEHVHQPAFIQINTSLCSDQKIKAEMKAWLTRLRVAAKLKDNCVLQPIFRHSGENCFKGTPMRIKKEDAMPALYIA